MDPTKALRDLPPARLRYPINRRINWSISLLREPLIQHGPLPDHVYRFFANSDYADDLSRGTLALSTLEICRAYEGAKQGDRGEAQQLYAVGRASGSDPHFKTAASRLGIGYVGDPHPHALVAECTSIERIPDAWVLCTTEQPDDALKEELGNYCVRIDRPSRFFQSLTARLCMHTDVMNRFDRAEIGKVLYGHREFSDAEDAPGPIGFVKPVDPYEPQREIRMLWVPRGNAPIGRLIVRCPAIARLCTRIF